MHKDSEQLDMNMDRGHRRRLKHAALRAFREVAQGRSPDDVVINETLNRRFLAAVAKRIPGVSAFGANWALLNIRKSYRINRVTATGPVLDHTGYQHAADVGVRIVEDLFNSSIDRILCDPTCRAVFDAKTRTIAPRVSKYRLRKGALYLRKKGRIRPEVAHRLVTCKKEMLKFTTRQIRRAPDRVPKKPGIYVFYDKHAWL